MHALPCRRLFLFAVIGIALTTILGTQLVLAQTDDATPAVQFQNDEAEGELNVLVEGELAFCYQYGDDVDLPHFYPINSPAGESMTVQQTEPYPHHRSFWFGDKVSLEGQRAYATYSALYSGVATTDASGAKTNIAPFNDGVRQVAFENETTEGDEGTIDCQLLWFMDRDTPVLDEHRTMRIRSLGDGEYFVDITFTVTAAYGDVNFVSDAVHYAWPYLRLNSEFAVPGGAVISSNEGPPTADRINNMPADWVDYSTVADGKNAGLAMFSHNDNPKPHGWLVRDYGTFGPRRAAEQNGKAFTLAEGESMQVRVGIYVHKGDVEESEVAELYEAYNEGDL